MGVTSSIYVLCDICGALVNYPGLAKDLEAETWYRANYAQTGAKAYLPKRYFCSPACGRKASLEKENA